MVTIKSKAFIWLSVLLPEILNMAISARYDNTVIINVRSRLSQVSKNNLSITVILYVSS
jgi:hypothetical protein